MQERLWPKDRSQVRKVVEVVLNEIDRAAAFGDPNRAAAFEEKHLRDVPKFKRRADLLASVPRGILRLRRVPRAAQRMTGALKGAFTLNRKLPLGSEQC
jgi:hypothetical protein